ncbi:MAG: hypothetical protein KAW56_13445 [Candidatus Marinimicrobia bacterium]|nr:hypothetical protein [Candidatus Neomarinimicrobiota bacterium]
MTPKITESAIEETALAGFEDLGYTVKFGPYIAFDGIQPERSAEANYADVVLVDRLRSALERINPGLPTNAIDDAIRQISHPESPALILTDRSTRC